MDELMILRTFAAVTTVLAASLVAANMSACHLLASSLHRCLDRLDGRRVLETKASLVIQNVILLVINVIGVWRWLPKAEKEAKS